MTPHECRADPNTRPAPALQITFRNLEYQSELETFIRRAVDCLPGLCLGVTGVHVVLESHDRPAAGKLCLADIRTLCQGTEVSYRHAHRDARASILGAFLELSRRTGNCEGALRALVRTDVVTPRPSTPPPEDRS